MKESKLNQEENSTKDKLEEHEKTINSDDPLTLEESNSYLDENLLYLQLSLLISSAILILLITSPKTTFIIVYSAILSIAAPLVSTSVVISTSIKFKITQIEYIILNSGIGVVGSFFCGLFLVKANFLPPDYLVLDFCPWLYYYLLGFLLVVLGVFSLAIFIKNIIEWFIHKEKLQVE